MLEAVYLGVVVYSVYASRLHPIVSASFILHFQDEIRELFHFPTQGGLLPQLGMGAIFLSS